MSGKIKRICNEIIVKNSGGNPTLENVTKTKLILRGINPGNYNEESADDPVVIGKLKKIADEFRLNIIFN